MVKMINLLKLKLANTCFYSITLINSVPVLMVKMIIVFKLKMANTCFYRIILINWDPILIMKMIILLNKMANRCFIA